MGWLEWAEWTKSRLPFVPALGENLAHVTATTA